MTGQQTLKKTLVSEVEFWVAICLRRCGASTPRGSNFLPWRRVRGEPTCSKHGVTEKSLQASPLSGPSRWGRPADTEPTPGKRAAEGCRHTPRGSSKMRLVARLEKIRHLIIERATNQQREGRGPGLDGGDKGTNAAKRQTLHPCRAWNHVPCATAEI